MLAGAVALDTDWGGSYRVTSVTSVDSYAEGELAGPVQITPAFRELARDEGERLRVRCSVEVIALTAAIG